ALRLARCHSGLSLAESDCRSHLSGCAAATSCGSRPGPWLADLRLVGNVGGNTAFLWLYRKLLFCRSEYPRLSLARATRAAWSQPLVVGRAPAWHHQRNPPQHHRSWPFVVMAG